MLVQLTGSTNPRWSIVSTSFKHDGQIVKEKYQWWKLTSARCSYRELFHLAAILHLLVVFAEVLQFEVTFQSRETTTNQ